MDLTSFSLSETVSAHLICSVSVNRCFERRCASWRRCFCGLCASFMTEHSAKWPAKCSHPNGSETYPSATWPSSATTSSTPSVAEDSSAFPWKVGR
uniref:Secreted protein n=1 Tax=Steinernema glaseri TaxID=37863 RepID=A0A1I7Y179_9BILA